MSRLLGYFRQNSPSARIAKERLRLVVTHERKSRQQTWPIEALQRDLLAVIQKHIDLPQQAIQMQLDHLDGCSVLEVNIVLPE